MHSRKHALIQCKNRNLLQRITVFLSKPALTFGSLQDSKTWVTKGSFPIHLLLVIRTLFVWECVGITYPGPFTQARLDSLIRFLTNLANITAPEFLFFFMKRNLPIAHGIHHE